MSTPNLQTNSITDFLSSIGKPSDFSYRTKLAQQLGIQNYKGTAEQNLQLLNLTRKNFQTDGAPEKTESQNQTNNGNMQKAVLAAVADVAENAALIGKPPVTFAEALSLAAKDPNIVNKYSDMLKIDTNQFTNSIKSLQDSTTTDAQKNLQQFDQAKKELADKYAAAGAAYSGFRGKANQNLEETEAGIVQSTRSQIQKNLQDLTTSFESRYGTGATVIPSIAYNNPLNGLPENIYGSTAGTSGSEVVGTAKPAKEGDITSSALSSYQTAQFPNI